METELIEPVLSELGRQDLYFSFRITVYQR